MGNCFGSGRQSQQKVNLNKQKSQRLSNWRATGTVSVRDGKLKDLPAMVEEVGSSTRTLDAANNKLSSLPPWLSSFTNLQRLILTSNQLVSLPSGMSALINLKVLMLDSNRLTQLPADIGSLKNLERLSVSGNDLTGLPAELGTLQKLVTLLMARNKLLELPSSLGQCVSLEEVDVTDNYLQVVLPEFGALKRLKTLTFDKNRIRAVPSEVLVGCSSLQTLSLHGNPITVEELQATEGYDAYEQRRRSKFDKKIATGVLMGSAGLDEGIDRDTTR